MYQECCGRGLGRRLQPNHSSLFQAFRDYSCAQGPVQRNLLLANSYKFSFLTVTMKSENTNEEKKKQANKLKTIYKIFKTT